VGAPLDDAAFATASVLDDGGARLRHDVYASPEGEPFLSSTRFFDLSMAETECEWRDPSFYAAEPPTGTLDCVPRDGAMLGSRYLDAGCTQRTASRFVFDDACPPPAQFAYAAGIVAALSGPIAGPGGYMLDDQDDCVELPPSDEGGSDGGYEGGEEHYLVADSSEVEAAHAADVVE
jgi:hypothetical protein